MSLSRSAAGLVILLLLALFFSPARGVTFRGEVLSASTSPASTSDPAAELPRADDAGGAITGVPDYMLETLKGKELRLSSLRGRVVLLDFFTATCPHCRKHAPFVADLAKRYRERGLVVVNLSPHNPYVDREVVETYAREAGIENDIVWSPTELFMLYMTPTPDGKYGVPQAVLFGADGRVAARFMRWEEKDRQEIEQTIANQLSRRDKK